MTTVTLPVGTGTQQWTPPADCLVVDLIEIWGPGGSGGKRAARVTGGGSGAYVSIAGPIDITQLKTSGTVPYQTGRGGAAQSTATTAGNPGTAKSWFYSSTVFASDLGLGGLASGTSGATAGGAGGLVANCIPTWAAKAGGNGGTDSSASGASAGGASGSAAGVGVNGAAISSAVAGGTTTAPAGGGNGGAASITAANATAGSSPGGGGGAINNASNSSGAGADGQINITYTPNLTITEAWDPSHTNPTVSLSSGDLTGTGTAATSSHSIAFGTVGQTSGKYYWEYVVTNVSSFTSVSVGIGQNTTSTAIGQWLGNLSATTLGWFPNAGANVYYNGSAVATWANFGNGTGIVLCLALDLDNGKIWGRNGIAGNWNNDVIGNQNPATNTGGYTLTGGVSGVTLYPAFNIFVPTDTITTRFTSTSWGGTAPAGFNAWVLPLFVPNILAAPLPQRVEMIAY